MEIHKWNRIAILKAINAYNKRQQAPQRGDNPQINMARREGAMKNDVCANGPKTQCANYGENHKFSVTFLFVVPQAHSGH